MVAWSGPFDEVLLVSVSPSLILIYLQCRYSAATQVGQHSPGCVTGMEPPTLPARLAPTMLPEQAKTNQAINGQNTLPQGTQVGQQVPGLICAV
jgi:hypothetical protein